MISIDVKASRSYQVLIGSGLLSQLGVQLASIQTSLARSKAEGLID